MFPEFRLCLYLILSLFLQVGNQKWISIAHWGWNTCHGQSWTMLLILLNDCCRAKVCPLWPSMPKNDHSTVVSIGLLVLFCVFFVQWSVFPLINFLGGAQSNFLLTLCFYVSNTHYHLSIAIHLSSLLHYV